MNEKHTYGPFLYASEWEVIVNLSILIDGPFANNISMKFLN